MLTRSGRLSPTVARMVSFPGVQNTAKTHFSLQRSVPQKISNCLKVFDNRRGKKSIKLPSQKLQMRQMQPSMAANEQKSSSLLHRRLFILPPAGERNHTQQLSSRCDWLVAAAAIGSAHLRAQTWTELRLPGKQLPPRGRLVPRPLQMQEEEGELSSALRLEN